MTTGSLTAKKKWIVSGGAIVAALAVLTGALRAGAFSASSSDGQPVSYSDRTLTPHLQVGVTPAGLLQSILGRIGTNVISSTSLGGPPAGLRESDDPNVPNSAAFDNAVWLRVTVRASALTPEATTEPIWLGNLIMGALRDGMFAAGQTPPYSSLISVVLPDGSRASDVGGGVGVIKLGQVFSSGSDGDIEAQIAAAASQAGYTVKSNTIFHADQPAPAVVVTTSTPEVDARNPDAVLTAIFGPPGTYEGEYLEVRSTDGTLVFVQGSSFRTGVGQRWVNPTFGGDNGDPPVPVPSGG